MRRCQRATRVLGRAKRAGMFKVKKPAPDARILRIRDYEDKLHSMQEKVAEQVRALPQRGTQQRLACPTLFAHHARQDRRTCSEHTQVPDAVFETR